jgi:hypothetical protein
MDQILNFRKKAISVSSLVFFLAVETWAQLPSVHVPQQEQQLPQAEDDTWWYVTLFLLILGLAAAVVWLYSSKKDSRSLSVQPEKKPLKQKKNNWDADSVDADKELEWFRKNQKVISKKTAGRIGEKTLSANKAVNKSEPAEEKAQNAKFEDLPVSAFAELAPSKEYALLPLSNDPALMSAIEQSQEEFEEDEEVRDLALRILAAFKTRNSAESLGQIALYDLSSSLRSKAVTTLAAFDHESVFENILLACADPTREVRAAAARGLFRLSFDRADAWMRIFETNDEFRMRQAAHAALEADLVERTFDRLVHPDQKIAYEAFTLTALLIKAGETEKIFKAIENHRDEKVKLALLHTLSVVKDENTLPNLYALLEQNSIPKQIKEKADKIIQSFELVPA